jgi:hypothetical protein
VKFALSLLLVSASFSMSACNTLVTRRDLFSPKKGSGPWTTRLAEYERTEGVFGVSHNYRYGRPGEEEGVFGVSRNLREDEEPTTEEGVLGVSRNRDR